MFEIERVRDRERKIGWNQWKGTDKIVRDRENFDIEGVQDREIPINQPIHKSVKKHPASFRCLYHVKAFLKILFLYDDCLKKADSTTSKLVTVFN